MCVNQLLVENVIFTMFWEDLGNKEISEVDKNMTIVCADLDYLYGVEIDSKMSHSFQENAFSKT